MNYKATTNYGVMFFNCSFSDFHLLKHLTVLFNLENSLDFKYHFDIKFYCFYASHLSSGLVVCLYFTKINELFTFYECFQKIIRLSEHNNDLSIFHKEFEMLDSFIVIKAFIGEIKNFIFFNKFYLTYVEFDNLYNNGKLNYSCEIVNLLTIKFGLYKELYKLLDLNF